MSKDVFDPKLMEAEARGRFAKEISDDAARFSAKLERARLAMQEDADLRQRLRKDVDHARMRGRELAQQLEQAEADIAARDGELEVLRQSETEAKLRNQELEADIATRDQKIAELEDRVSELSHQYAEAAHMVTLSRDRATAKDSEANRTKQDNEKLRLELETFKSKSIEQEARADRLEMELRAAKSRLSLQEEALAGFAKRFDEAAEIYDATLAVLGDQRDAHVKAQEELAVQLSELRQRLHDGDARMARLDGQVTELRSENAALRAETEVQVLELEKARDEALADIGVLKRRLHEIMPVKVVGRIHKQQDQDSADNIELDNSIAS